MTAWSLSDNAIQQLVSLPETGMGFQLVSAQLYGESKPFIVFNGELAIDLSGIELAPSIDPSVVLANGLRVLNAVRTADPIVMVGRPEPRSFSLLESRIGELAITAPGTVAPAPASQIAQPSSLVKVMTLSSNRRFHRYSAFNPDKRVDPKTGDFAFGTYATPASEVPFIPTGFAAVGRLALPNVLLASFHYMVEASVGTKVQFSTVAPACGQAGGGVEAYLPKGVKNQQSPSTPPSQIPDE